MICKDICGHPGNLSVWAEKTNDDNCTQPRGSPWALSAVRQGWKSFRRDYDLDSATSRSQVEMVIKQQVFRTQVSSVPTSR